ncbi:MAG TPA: putative DNA modification/repair radical SAM protein [Kofleriaceae bacterium]|nr:putative DNA modification/repair radical SAM protein [Kofleriaceae bacterium]
MDVRKKLSILADAAKYDASCASSGAKRGAQAGGIGHATGEGICHSYTPDGRCVSLLKILLTNKCTFDCTYCINRRSSDIARAAFSPDEVVELTLAMYRRNYIEGLFLSSGVLRDPDYTMELVTRVARTLRETHRFGGYIHLKGVAGASDALLAEAGRWCDRLSVNIELPTAPDLAALAPEKSVPAIVGSMTAIRDAHAEAPRAFAPAGQSTQMIVGATPTPDAAILRTAASLYERFKLRRVYYTAYSPTQRPDARLPSEAPPLMREHRLYEADWLLRHYGFHVDELTTPEAPNLDHAIDPKLAWALRHRERFPVDLDRAERELLLRVPGLGVRNVDRILAMRRLRAIRLEDLARLRVSLAKAGPFVLTSDHNPDAKLIDRLDLRARVAPAQQLSLDFGGGPGRT